MESFFGRYKNALVLIVVLLAQVVGLAVQARRPEGVAGDVRGVRVVRDGVSSLITPPERFMHNSGRGMRGIWADYVGLLHVRQQNEKLQAEVDRLRIEQASVAEDARQAQRLQALLDFRERYVATTTPAQVIGASGSESRIIYIDKGSDDGLTRDMPVITADGIVGKTRDVFPHTSQVLEISDPSSGTGVVLETTRLRGVVRGNSYGQPQIVDVMPDDRIKPGEAVITSGGDQIFPRGLPVGVVERVERDPDHDPMLDVLIKPATNLSKLEEVLVITGTTPQMPAQTVHDVAESELQSDQQKASDVLAERLPSRIDADDPDARDESDDSADGEVGRPMRPPAALHPDHFTPDSTPAAASLTPGARLAPEREGTVSYPPQAKKVAAVQPVSATGAAGSNRPDSTPTGTWGANAAAAPVSGGKHAAKAAGLQTASEKRASRPPAAPSSGAAAAPQERP